LRQKSSYFLEVFRQNFLVLPGTMALGAAVFAGLLVAAERSQTGYFETLTPWIRWDASGAQTILTALAGATASTAGVVFSIMMVTLSIASSQLGPRLIRAALKLRSAKFTLGLLIGSTVYCLAILTTISGTDDAAAVPHVAVLLAILFAIAGFFAMLLFIHDVAHIIQAPNVIRVVARDLDEAIDHLIPVDADSSGDEEQCRALLDALDGGTPIPARFEGYIVAIDINDLVEFAESQDLVLRLLKRPGHFVVRDSIVAECWPTGADAEEVAARLADTVICGPRPTPNQDVECAINELVEVASRALSPGINDPFTAINCIDFLGASLSRILQRPPVRAMCLGGNGRVRIIQNTSDFPGILSAAYDQIRQYAQDNVAVTLRLMENLEQLAAFARREADRAALTRHAAMVKASGERTFFQESDIIDLNARYERFKTAAQTTAGQRT